VFRLRRATGPCSRWCAPDSVRCCAAELVLRGRRPPTADGDAEQPTNCGPAPRPREIFLLWQAGRTRPSPLAARAIQIAVDTANAIATLTGSPGQRRRPSSLSRPARSARPARRDQHLIRSGAPG
jgi:hypothetical protein